MVFIVVVKSSRATIFPQWRIPDLEPDPPTASICLLLSLTIVLAVILLLVRICSSLIMRWERLTQVTSCDMLC